MSTASGIDDVQVVVGGLVVGNGGLDRRLAVGGLDVVVRRLVGADIASRATITGTGPVDGVRFTYSSGSPSGCISDDDVDSDEACPLERLHQTIAAVDQLLDLLAGQFASPSELARALVHGTRGLR